MAKTKREMETSVVGIRHRITKPRMRQMDAEAPLRVQLVREPENLHDENAISVELVDELFETSSQGMKIGYVPRLVAAELAGLMDAEVMTMKEAWVTAINADEGTGDLVLRFEIGSGKPKSPKKKIPAN